MRRTPATLAAPLLIAAAWGAGCETSAPPVADAGPAVGVEIAALQLDGVGDVVWDVEVVNGASPAETVWQRRLTSSGYGDGAGSASYVGPCDAADGVAENTVRVWVVGVYAAPVTAAGSFAAGATNGATGTPLDFENPTAAAPLERVVTCSENADAAAHFDVALMRPARQGFFDIALEFNDVFCSAKLDCCVPDGTGSACASDLELLFDDTGARAATMVLGFACTAGPGAGVETELFLDPITLDCTSPTAGSFDADVALDPATGAAGNQCVPGPDAMSGCPAVSELHALDADSVLYQLGVYRGVETLTSGGAPAQKVYWNVALGVRRPAIAGCWLRTRATADDALATPLVDHGVIAAGAVYPYVQWDVDLSACVAEALTFGDPAAPVRADYTGTGDGATAFAYGFGPSLPAGSLCTPACEHGGACLAGTCDCTGTGWGGAVCATPLASCLAIRDAGASFGSGLYTIDPDGAGGADPVEAWCDMDADGGGWTLVLHATRPDGTYFASNYSNYVPMGIDTAATPTPSVEGRKLNALADVPFTQVAALSIDGAPFVPNCVWDARSDLGYRINANNWSIKADGVPYVGLQALANDCYGANYGATGVTKNYASAGVGATYNAIHTQWSNFMIVDDGLVTTSAESAATKGLSFAVYNAEYRYFSGESCTTGVRVGFDTAIIGVR